MSNAGKTKTTRTINDWRPETRSLIRTLKAHGFGVVSVNDGDDGWHKVKGENAAIDILTSVDIAYMRVGPLKGHALAATEPSFRSTLTLVYGNSPGELVCDYSFPAATENGDAHRALDAATEKHFDAWSERKQPTREVSR